MKKNKSKVVCLCLFITLVFAFNKGDQIELEAYLNARSSAAFLKTSNNVKTQLASGTRGEVLESKKMPSGNYGIKLKVESGPHSGESYWVYLNTKTPQMKLFDKKQKEIALDGKVDNVPKAKDAKLTEKVGAIRDPEEAAVNDAAITAKEILTPKAGQAIVPSPAKPDCLSQVSSDVNEADYKVENVVKPFRAYVTRVPTQDKICRDQGNGIQYEVCSNSQTHEIEGFVLKNVGPNNILKSKDYHREFKFLFDERAGSDMKLELQDFGHENASADSLGVMVFFPRSVLPAIKQVGDELIVTLPTKEIVRFNAKTKEITGGVFTEGPMVVGAKVKPTDITYTGTGVVIRSNNNGDTAYGDMENKQGVEVPSSLTSTVSKKGYPDCKIPVKDIWYSKPGTPGAPKTDSSPAVIGTSSRTYIKQDLASDSGMDVFLKKRCGFSLY